MKLILLSLLLAMASCAPAPAEWQGSPNPLDTPVTYVNRPSAMGAFGPHSEYYR